MKLLTYIGCLGVLLIGLSCNTNQKKETQPLDLKTDSVALSSSAATDTEANEITVTLTAKNESDVRGTIHFKEVNGTVQFTANVQGLTPGEHAIHIHEKGDCSSADATSTGGHWNPTNQPHGKWGDEAGFHLGDIGNLTADQNGNATLTLATDMWCIGCDDTDKSILNRAIIIHQGVDDFSSQPSGNAGKRIACAVIK